MCDGVVMLGLPSTC